MRILAIETSCDETAMSILESSDGVSFDLLAHEIASQAKLHTEYGGVVPMLAKREHMTNLPIILDKILNNPNLLPINYQLIPNLIAVTYGPGLEPALWTGLNFAKELATKWNIPLVATDHMHGHIVSAQLESKKANTYNLTPITYPAIALLISGGHTQLVLMRDWEDFETVGQTVDDAVGEAFDKVARMLGLPYPGGPEIDKLATQFVQHRMLDRKEGSIGLPRPMLHSKDLNFSFSGLKTAVLYLIKKLKDENKLAGLVNEIGEGELTYEQKCGIAYEFTQAVVEVLTKKTARAIEQFDTKSLLVGGGVIANKPIREALNQLQGSTLKLYLPDMKFTGDNATMIGIAGYLHSRGGTVNTLLPNSPELESLKANGNLSLYK